MSSAKMKKEALKKKSSNSVFARLHNNWKQKRPVLYFVLAFAVLLSIFYLFLFTAFFENHIQVHIVSLNASISGFILNLFGQHTFTSGSFITSSVFSINVKRGCDAVEPMALFAAALLAFPSSIKNKIKGLLIGISILFVLNIIRIVSLFLTGIYYPSVFEIMHIEVWQFLFILFALGLWIILIRKPSKIKADAQA